LRNQPQSSNHWLVDRSPLVLAHGSFFFPWFSSR